LFGARYKAKTETTVNLRPFMATAALSSVTPPVVSSAIANPTLGMGAALIGTAIAAAAGIKVERRQVRVRDWETDETLQEAPAQQELPVIAKPVKKAEPAQPKVPSWATDTNDPKLIQTVESIQQALAKLETQRRKQGALRDRAIEMYQKEAEGITFHREELQRAERDLATKEVEVQHEADPVQKLRLNVEAGKLRGDCERLKRSVGSKEGILDQLRQTAETAQRITEQQDLKIQEEAARYDELLDRMRQMVQQQSLLKMQNDIAEQENPVTAQAGNAEFQKLQDQVRQQIAETQVRMEALAIEAQTMQNLVPPANDTEAAAQQAILDQLLADQIQANTAEPPRDRGKPGKK
jgi:hypothetical protein